MREDEFFLYINGQRVRVSEEIYKECRHSEDKEQYFMEHLKRSRYVKDKDSGRTEYIPSREVSYEKLLEESHGLRHQEEANQLTDGDAHDQNVVPLSTRL